MYCQKEVRHLFEEGEGHGMYAENHKNLNYTEPVLVISLSRRSRAALEEKLGESILDVWACDAHDIMKFLIKTK
jgi:hypothetical protein